MDGAQRYTSEGLSASHERAYARPASDTSSTSDAQDTCGHPDLVPTSYHAWDSTVSFRNGGWIVSALDRLMISAESRQTTSTGTLDTAPTT